MDGPVDEPEGAEGSAGLLRLCASNEGGIIMAPTNIQITTRIHRLKTSVRSTACTWIFVELRMVV
jgi:hypothetical protein